MTGLAPKERFASHKAASVVKRYGIRLLPDLYEHLKPMPFEAAVEKEKDLAEDLRQAGYTVTGGIRPARGEFGRLIQFSLGQQTKANTRIFHSSAPICC
jgi:hypothetical protein